MLGPVSEPEAPQPPPTSALDGPWEQLQAEWGTPEAHQRFLALAQTLNALGEAGRRYREVRDGDPERKAEADKRLSAIVILATEALRATRENRPKKAYDRVQLLGIGLALGLIAWAMWAMANLR